MIALGAIWAAFRALDATPRRPAPCAEPAEPADATAQRWSGPALLGAVLLFALSLPAFGLVISAGLAATLAAIGAGETQSGRARGHGVRAGCHDDGDRTYTFAAHGAALASFVKRPGHGSERMNSREFALALTPENLILCVVGAVVGNARRRPARHRPAATLALLLPLTFTLEPAGAIIMMAAIYYGAQYGGSTTSILLNVPGECSGVVTALDGHKMALAGRAGPAIAVASLASLFAGLVTAVLIATIAVPLAGMTTAIAPAGLVGLIALGLFAAAVISPGPAIPALALILIGRGSRSRGTI